MRMSLKILFGLFLGCILVISGCKKEEGLVGKKVVSGVIYYQNGASGTEEPAASAIVYIWYGETTATGSYDQTTTTNSNGEYTIKGLQKGNYFITAEYSDGNGFSYSTPGYVVDINNKKSALNLDIHLE